MGKSFSMSSAPKCIGENGRLSSFFRPSRSHLLHGRDAACCVSTIVMVTSMLALFWGTLFAQEHPAADTIITNANVWTVDRNHPKAEAVAILNQRIVAVGTSVRLDRWRGPRH